MPLENVEVTPLRPERFAEVLPPDALLPMQDAEESSVIVNALQRRARGRPEEPCGGLRADGVVYEAEIAEGLRREAEAEAAPTPALV